MKALIDRLRAILGFKTSNANALLVGSKNIYTMISSAVALFPSPIVTMAALLGLIQTFEVSQSGVRSGTKGATTTRNNAAKPLIIALQQLVNYVQGLADASPATAATIILAAGMQIRHVSGPRVAAPLTLTNGTPSGTVILRAYATLLSQGHRNASYSWQFSVDGEKTWQSLPSTPIARTTITGLAPATVVAARVAVTVGKQPLSAWTPAVTLVVA